MSNIHRKKVSDASIATMTSLISSIGQTIKMRMMTMMTMMVLMINMVMIAMACVPGSPFVTIGEFSFVPVCAGAFPFVALFFFVGAFSFVSQGGAGGRQVRWKGQAFN